MRVPVVVIGAGHAGLAISFHLSRCAVDHVVLERGEVANTWRTERWESLRLLTPNWQARLPDFAYDGPDPDGYLSMPEVVEFIAQYAKHIDAPVHTNTTVESVVHIGDHYLVIAGEERWECDAVVLASGGFNLPKVPDIALGPDIDSVTLTGYKRADGLAKGGVLVVGASATGVQLAEEIHQSGRPVTLAVGGHVRMPRVYRGRDILWWIDETGLADERHDEVDDVVRARRVPSPQLIGSPERRTIDLNVLTDQGVRLTGKLAAVRDGEAIFSGSLRNVCELADLKQIRLLNTIDEHASDAGLKDIGAPERYDSTRVPDDPLLTLSLRGAGISTVVWATGYRPDYSWLHIPVLDRKGEIHHDGGVVTDSPGLYRIGLTFLRRRKSSFIHGAADDARDIVDHLVEYLVPST